MQFNKYTYTHTQTHGNESNGGNGNKDKYGNGNDDIIGEGGGETKKCKKSYKTYRRHVGNGRDLGRKSKKRRKERVGPVAANPDNLQNNNEAGVRSQGTQSSSKNCTQVEKACPLCRV